MAVVNEIKTHMVGMLDLKEFVTVDETTPVSEVLRAMRTHDTSTTLVTREGRLTGIFTERDVLKKVVPDPEALGRPIRELMTPEPVVVRPQDTILAALRMMNEGRFRDLPVVDATGRIVGNLTDNAIVRQMGDRLQAEVLNLPPDPNQVPKTVEGA
jgi:CBS domain-containing protein